VRELSWRGSIQNLIKSTFFIGGQSQLFYYALLPQFKTFLLHRRFRVDGKKKIIHDTQLAGFFLGKLA